METRYPYPLLNPPAFRWRRPDPLPADPKVHEWIQCLDEEKASSFDWSEVDVTLLGVPLSRSSLSASGASETPDAIGTSRKRWSPCAPIIPMLCRW